MRTLSFGLFSLTGILALENGSDNGGVGEAQMPDCAVNCIKEHVPNSGCDLPHITCLCDPDFRTKHGPAIAPCLIVLCDANEINKVQNAWRDQCDGVPSTQKDQESVKSLVEEDASTAVNGSTQHLGSSPGRKGFNTNDHDIDAKAGAKINPTEVNTKTNPNTNNLEFNLERNFNFNFKLDPKTNAYANAEILDEFYQLIRKRN
ncbi:hypothetical protein FALCPG4_008165 [Fusarium falciforme]